MRLFDSLEAFGRRTAVLADSGELLDYRQLAARADASVRALPAGCRLLALDGDNSIAALCAYVGALRAGLPVIMLDPAMDAQARQALLQRYGVDAWWSVAACAWLPLAPRRQAAPHPDLALLLSTSGSTASPKLVRLSHRALAANAASIASYLELDEHERPITSLPMHYSYGMSVVHSHLLAGACLLLTAQPLVARAFWNFFRGEGATSLAGVPAMYDMLERLRLHEMELPTLRTLTQAGGKLRLESVLSFAALAREHRWRFYVMYGQTEAGPRMSWLPPGDLPAKAGSIGLAIPGGRLSIVDGQGKPVAAPGVEGELLYQGPNVMMGYAQQIEDLALGDVQQQRLLTGDLGYADADGYVYLTGRAHRFLKMSGKRLSLDEVEQYASTLGLCTAATGRDDLLLLAVMKADQAPLQISRQLCAHFRLHHASVRVVDVPDFPRSGAGKVRYGELMDSLLNQS